MLLAAFGSATTQPDMRKQHCQEASFLHYCYSFLFACVLSVACLLRGAVYDISVSVFIICCLLLLAGFNIGKRAIASEQLVVPFKQAPAFLMGFSLLIILQLLLYVFSLPSSPSIAYSPTFSGHIFDISSWLAAIGRFLLCVLCILIAMHIGQSKALCSFFLRTVLFSGLACVLFTFLHSGAYHYTPTQNYTHGFVNANNAAAYLGVLLCLSIWKLHRLSRRLRRSRRLSFMAWFERLSLLITGRAALLLFAIILFCTGLFLTGSRAGTALSLAGAAGYCMIVIIKKSVRRPNFKFFIITLGLLTLCSVGLLVLYQSVGGALAKDISRFGFAFTDRPHIYQACITMLQSFPLLGVGYGGFRQAFPFFRPEGLTPEGIVEKSYSSYLEIGSELGVLAMLTLLIATLLAGYSLFSALIHRRKHYGYAALGFCIWGLVTLYSLIDFPLQIPGLQAVAISIITICCCQCQRRPHRARRSRIKPLT